MKKFYLFLFLLIVFSCCSGSQYTRQTTNNNSGERLDSDYDGIPDTSDPCPQSTAGYHGEEDLDHDGCVD